MSKMLFIKTKDEETAQKLKDEGYELLNTDNSTWTFINDMNKKFNFNNKNIVYTDVLTF